MKINPVDIKVGYQFKSYVEDDNKWYKTEVKEIQENHLNGNHQLTLVDVDPNSAWQGMDWSASIEDLMNTSQYKQL